MDRLSEQEIAYLNAIEEWCQLGNSLWVALVLTDTSESEFCRLVRFSRRGDIELATQIKPYIDRILAYPCLYRNGEGPLFYQWQTPTDRRVMDWREL